MEFKSFGEIKRWSPLKMTITQKLHGSNGQITVFTNENGELDVRAGSRTRFIFPGPNTDNYGFAQFVQDNKAEIIEKLGEGTHYGEWIGSGINSGEGVKEKMFVLFNHNRPYPLGLPPRIALVPVLYEGEPKNVQLVIEEVMEDLKRGGSLLVPGFMRTEGIVIELNGQRRKLVFEAEDTGWKGTSKVKVRKDFTQSVDYTYLCQLIRLEKLLSRDEVYIREYPKSLGSIVKDYMADLEKEGQLPSDPDECKAVKKNAAGQIFAFIKTIMRDIQV